MAAPDEQDTTIPANGSATVVITPPAETPAQTAALEAIAARMEAVETQITQAVEGERTWTTSQISSLTQELADLKATLAEVTTNQPQALTELRAELTRLSQELQALKTSHQQPPLTETTVVIPVETPPETPPDNSPAPRNAEGQPDHETPPIAPTKRPKRRVI